jgi:hypothetical protein
MITWDEFTQWVESHGVTTRLCESIELHPQGDGVMMRAHQISETESGALKMADDLTPEREVVEAMLTRLP